MKVWITALFLFGYSSLASAYEITPQAALEAERAGDHDKAVEIFSLLANDGDSRAMIHIGNKYYTDNGVNQDYSLAMDWWLKAFRANNGDAPSNIGVLYRDGSGVVQNRKVAYILFLLTHMEGLGSQSTQIRAARLLEQQAAELSESEVQEALCYTWPYVVAYVENRGPIEPIPEAFLPSKDRVRFKDNSWWLKSERQKLTFSCPEPWGQ
ncbi:hypothetical protein LCGC14_2358430 [marine sediment metagenome]|uniref:Sel1 repeat family protein n=1 Tax=marine sediment metagenome TaxID=412755 RepID=A0A0F9F260_9ZZZZ